jgi:uncharacterized oxidoreductase
VKLHDKKVLVTGGTEGIGLALVEALVARGCHVVTCSRHAPAASGKAADVFRPGAPGKGRVTHLQCDLTLEAERLQLVDKLKQDHRDLSVVIHNAAVQHLTSFPDDAYADIAQRSEQEIALNFTAPVLLTAALLPLLRAHGEAAFISITTGLALAPKRSSPVYCATKAAVRSFTKSLRYQVEQAGGGLRIIEALPPLVDTRMTAGRGAGKVAPADVAQALIAGVEAGKQEIFIGKSKLLKVLFRLSPALVERILKNW